MTKMIDYFLTEHGTYIQFALVAHIRAGWEGQNAEPCIIVIMSDKSRFDLGGDNLIEFNRLFKAWLECKKSEDRPIDPLKTVFPVLADCRAINLDGTKITMEFNIDRAQEVFGMLAGLTNCNDGSG